MNPDGSAPVQLTSGAYNDYEPSVSPNGRKVAFSRAVQGETRSEIWVVPMSASEPTQLTNELTYTNNFPTWSPDGQEIAFVRQIPNTPFTGRIWRIPARGGTPRKVSPASGLSRMYPDWSPDGSNILFSMEVGAG